ILISDVVADLAGIDAKGGGDLVGDELEPVRLHVDQPEELESLVVAHRGVEADAGGREPLHRHDRVLELVADLRGQVGPAPRVLDRSGAPTGSGPHEGDDGGGEEARPRSEQESAGCVAHRRGVYGLRPAGPGGVPDSGLATGGGYS